MPSAQTLQFLEGVEGTATDYALLVQICKRQTVGRAFIVSSMTRTLHLHFAVSVKDSQAALSTIQLPH